jgi:N-acetylmuramoyl-L-alanine amidase
MAMRANHRRVGATALAIIVAGSLVPVYAQTARERYEIALDREETLRSLLDRQDDLQHDERTQVLKELGRLVASYEAIPRRFPTTGYADNALWQGASLSESAFRRFARPEDRSKALQLYDWLIREYPASSFVKRAKGQLNQLDELARATEAASAEPAAPAADPPAEAAPATAASVTAPDSSGPSGPSAPPSASSPARTPVPSASSGRAMLTGIRRAVLPQSVRVTLELEREVAYREERIGGPDRVFFDLKGVQLAQDLVDTALTFSDDVVKQIRTGRHPESTVRVVIDLEGVSRYSVFTLYNPFRVVIDCERSAPVPVRVATTTPPVDVTPLADPMPPAPKPAPPAVVAAPVPAPAPAPSPAVADVTPAAPPPAVPPTDSPAAPIAPSSNTKGGFSLSRQLGLSVSRIVIDPGHGGHDPGARVSGLEEAALTLDVALRLEKLLQKETGVEVVLTRRGDTYVPLEERTAIANREGADLFLSIHANASRNAAARGIETYFLSFASSPEAEAVAARENSASERAMHNLPDIIKAIALNNKLDESRDLAAMVQESLVTRLRKTNRDARNLGVKKAPFVVLIGAGMPSVLAEISFLTNRQEASLLKTAAYKQKIAESLHEAVMKYRASLKRQATVADRP